MSVVDVTYAGFVCEHQPSQDPRKEGRCVKCGLLYDEPRLVRDASYETAYLKHVVEEVERRFGINANHYAGSVIARLKIGESRYGDDDFLTKDNLLELSEEPPDIAAYALLETEKRMQSGAEVDESVLFYLHEAAVYAAAADWCVRQARRSE